MLTVRIRCGLARQITLRSSISRYRASSFSSIVRQSDAGAPLASPRTRYHPVRANHFSHTTYSNSSIPAKPLLTRPGDDSSTSNKPPSVDEIQEQYRLYRSRMAYAGTLRLVVLEASGFLGGSQESSRYRRMHHSVSEMSDQDREHLTEDMWKFYEALGNAAEAAFTCKKMCDVFLNENRASRSKRQDAEKRSDGQLDPDELAETAVLRVRQIRKAVLRPSRYWLVKKYWKEMLGGTVIAAIILYEMRHWSKAAKDG